MPVEIQAIIWATICSGIITFLTIPVVINIAFEKKLVAKGPDQSKAWSLVPNLGGIGIFPGILIAFTLFSSIEIFSAYKYILTALLCFFFMGIKNDLAPISTRNKIGFQFLVAALLTYGGIRISSLHGLFGIYELSTFSSCTLSMLFIIGITNAFRFSDDIEGLAGGLGGINCATLAALLLWIGEYNYAVLGFAITGSLLAFLRFNYGRFPNKISMGEAGSLLLGLTVTILSIRFIESPKALETLSVISPIGIIAGIIFIPLFDSLRVFIIRLSKGRSLLKARKSHIHDQFTSSGISHKKAGFLMYLGNIALIINVLFFKNQTAIVLILSSMVIVVLLFHMLLIWRFRNRSTKVTQLSDELKKLEEENCLIV